MSKPVSLVIACALLGTVSCRSGSVEDQAARAQKAFKREGPLAVAAIYISDARKGNARAAFYVATAYSVEAAQQRKIGAAEPTIRSLEDSALHWYHVAEKGGNEEAQLLLKEVRKHGRSALYFVSIEHLLNDDPTPETHPERFYRPIKH